MLFVEMLRLIDELRPRPLPVASKKTLSASEQDRPDVPPTGLGGTRPGRSLTPSAWCSSTIGRPRGVGFVEGENGDRQGVVVVIDEQEGLAAGGRRPPSGFRRPIKRIRAALRERISIS